MPPPSRATIHRILRTAGLVAPEPRKRPKSSLHRFEAAVPNETWQADITHWPLENGAAADILDFLDDHSRYLLHLQAYRPCTGADVVEAMNALIKRYGAPASTLTDNGMVFTSRFASRPGARNGFETLLATHRIQQKNGSPGHPQTQGKIERFHQTLKRWLVRRPLAPDLPALQAQLDEFRHWYNHDRPHRATGRRTPATAYAALPKAVPESTPEQGYRTRTDRIDANGKVSIRYAGQLRHLGIGRAHRGAPVLLLIHDDRVTTTHSGTGKIIAEHRIDPTRDYQPKLRPD